MKSRSLLDEMNRSIPSLHYQTNEMDGWADRLAKQYGYKALRGIVAGGIGASTSPSLDPLYRVWATSTGVKPHDPGIPFAYLQYLAHYLMKKEGFGAADQANIRTQPMTGKPKPTHALKYIGGPAD